MPLVIWRMSFGLAPKTEMRTDCSPFVPPVSTPLVGDTAPGTNASMLPMLLLVGSAVRVSLLMTATFATLRTSTSGVSPDTVTVSDKVPTRSSALIVATKLGIRSSPSRLNVVNPVSVKVTE